MVLTISSLDTMYSLSTHCINYSLHKAQKLHKIAQKCKIQFHHELSRHVLHINMMYCRNIEYPTREMNGMRILVYGLKIHNNKNKNEISMQQNQSCKPYLTTLHKISDNFLFQHSSRSLQVK